MKFDTNTLTTALYAIVILGSAIYIFNILRIFVNYARAGGEVGFAEIQNGFAAFCKDNAPKEDKYFVLFGLICLASTFCTMYVIPSKGMDNQDPLFFFYQTSMMFGVLFTAFHIWPLSLKNDYFISMFWNVGAFYVPIVCVTFYVFVGQFEHALNMVFLLNMLGLALIVPWRVLLVAVPLGMFCAIKYYEVYTQSIVTYATLDAIKFHTSYVVISVATLGAVFVRPKFAEFSSAAMVVTLAKRKAAYEIAMREWEESDRRDAARLAARKVVEEAERAAAEAKEK